MIGENHAHRRGLGEGGVLTEAITGLVVSEDVDVSAYEWLACAYKYWASSDPRGLMAEFKSMGTVLFIIGGKIVDVKLLGIGDGDRLISGSRNIYMLGYLKAGVRGCLEAEGVAK